MNCAWCDARPFFGDSILLIRHGRDELLFCGDDCLRAWLAPDRSNSQLRNDRAVTPLSPQPIVVPTPELEPREGESAVAYLQRLMKYGLFEKG